MRSSARRLTSAAALLTVLCFPASAAWQPVQQLTAGTIDADLPVYGSGLAVHGQSVHVVFSYVDNEQLQIHYMRSTDSGGSWALRTMLDDTLISSAFSIVADNSGNVHFISRRPTGLWYRRSTDNGWSWSAPVCLAATAESAVLMTNGVANVYVVDAILAGGGEVEVRFLRSTDGGVTWDSPVVLARRVVVSAISAVADPAGRIHVAYSYGILGTDQIYYLRSTNNGSNWEAQRQLSDRQGTIVNGLWNGGGNNTYLTMTVPFSQLNFRRSTDGGATWQAAVSLFGRPAAIAGAIDGRSHAVTAADGQRVVYARSRDNGATWDDTLTISTGPVATRTKPFIACNLDDLACIWNSRETGSNQVYFRLGAGLGGVTEQGRAPEPGRPPLVPNPARLSVQLAGTAPVGLCDRSGRHVAILKPGTNSIAGLRSGVYFIVGSDGRDLGRLVKTD